MIILIAGATHTGKTLLAQKLLKRFEYPYLSIDHLKMGLIRSGQTTLTPESDDETLTAYLWTIVKEMIKTCIENNQNLIVEGCYIPLNFKNDFTQGYLSDIRFMCLIFSGHYIKQHFEDIARYESVIENRGKNCGLSAEEMAAANERNLNACKANGLKYILINDKYSIDEHTLLFT